MVAFEEEELGWQDMHAGQLEAAEDHFRRALDLDPMRSGSLVGLGVVYLTWGDLEDAEELFHLALLQAEEDLPDGLRPGSTHEPLLKPYLRALYYLAVTSVRQGRWQEAEVFLQQMLTWDAEGMEGEAFPLLAEAYHRSGHLEEAAYYYERSLDRDPWSWYSLGAVYLSLGDVSSAETLLRQALNQIPEVGQWIMHFPKVVPLPNGTLVDEAFRQAVSYLVDHIDLWPESSRKELQAIGARLVASV